jgi:hypothetical protein
MNPTNDNTIRLTRRAAIVGMAGTVASLAACGGGGGGVAGLSSGGTGSFATGTVAGLGSVIVNGVRYDDSVAAVSRSDDGTVAALRAGMVVAIFGSAVSAATAAGALPTATANRISYASEWVGPVGAVNSAGRTLTVLGQIIDVPVTAVFEGAATDLTTVTTAQFVEVHGYLDVGTGRLLATRIEVANVSPGAFRLSGRVAALDNTARTFSLGTTTIGYPAALSLPSGFANGMLVRVTLATAQVGGVWQATRIRVREALLAQVEVAERAEAEIEGTVTSVESSTRFSVNGIPVNASGVSVPGTLAVGSAVEVHGTAVAGVIVATRLELKGANGIEVQDFDFIGPVSNVDTVARTFVLKGLNFSYTASTRNEVVGWVNGATPTVRVKATPAGGAWIASEIRLQS